MHRTCLALPLAAALIQAFLAPANALAGPASPAAIRAAVPYPVIDMNLNFEAHYDLLRGTILNWEFSSAEDERPALRQELKHNPEDPLLTLRLGEAEESQGDPAAAALLFLKAESLYRTKWQQKNEDPAVSVGLCRALGQLHRSSEAEAAARATARLHPNDWRAADGLGLVLLTRVAPVLIADPHEPSHIDEITGPGQQDLYRFLGDLQQRQVPSTRLKAGRRLVEEAERLLDRAVELAPRESGPRLVRGDYRLFRRPVADALLRAAAGQHVLEVNAAPGDAGAIQDVQAAAERSPQNVAIQSMGLVFQWLALMGKPASQLSTADRGAMQACTARLGAIANGANKDDAAEALCVLGLWGSGASGSWDVGLNAAQQALQRKPGYRPAVLLTLGAYEEKQAWADALAFCQEQLRSHDDPLLRLIAGRLYDRQGKEEQAAEQVEAALRLDPASFAARLARAALLLKRDSSPVARDRVRAALLDLAEDLGKASSTEHSSYRLLNAALLGLSGNLAAARHEVRQVAQDKTMIIKVSPLQKALGDAEVQSGP